MKTKLLLFVSAFLFQTVTAQWQNMTNDYITWKIAGGDGTSIYCGTYSFSKSTNQGQTFTPLSMNSSSPSGYANYVEFNGSTIFLENFISNDGGATFNPITPNINIRCYKRDGNTIYAGTKNGIKKTTDNGVTWTDANTGLNANAYVNKIVIDGAIMYAATDGGLYKSIDNAQNWTMFSAVEARSLVVNGNLMVTFSPENIYRLNVSTNGGSTWTNKRNGLPNTALLNGQDIFSSIFYVLDIRIIGSNILLATNKGVYMSSDNGDNWIDISVGLESRNVNSIYDDGTYVYVGTDGGLFRRAITDLTVTYSISKTVNVSTAGTLVSLLTHAERGSIQNLTLTGHLNATDIAFLRNYATFLSTLDLSAVTIDAYTGTQGPVTNQNTVYPANYLPSYSFYFYGTSINNITLTSVTLPNNLDSVGQFAFYGATKLSTVMLGNSIKRIGSAAFQKCTALNSFEIPNSGTSIGSGATIGETAFGYCSTLTSVTIPAGIISIGNYAFYRCTSLKTINNLNTTPPMVGVYCFYADAAITDVFVPTDQAVTDYRANATWIGLFPGTIIKKSISTDSKSSINTHLKVYSRVNEIIIKGTQKGEQVDIYSINGTKVFSGKSQGEIIAVPLKKQALYLVKTTTHTYKVSL